MPNLQACTERWTDGQTEERTDKRTNGWTDGRTEGRTDELIQVGLGTQRTVFPGKKYFKQTTSSKDLVLLVQMVFFIFVLGFFPEK